MHVGLARIRHFQNSHHRFSRPTRLEKTNDWVVLHCDDGPREHQWTIITAGFGPLRGRRIVRGREDECSALFSMTSEKAAASEQPESAIDPIVQTTGRHG